MNNHTRTIFCLATLLVALYAQAQQQGSPPPQSAGGVAASEPRFRPVRSISGTKGAAQGGRFTMEDPRTVFYIPQDRQVVVYFDWEGPLGNHRFEALWKNPQGKVSVITDFSFEAKDKRFGGYFTLLLSETVDTGIWTMEARIDGEAAGSHTFQILAAARPAGEANQPLRVPLAPSQIYQRASASTFFVDKYDANGEKLQTGSGFLIGEDMVVTAFQVIDGASRVKVLLPDGKTVEAEHVVAWNRWQDWAILRVPVGTIPKLLRAANSPSSVGDRCYSLDVPADGSRSILDVDIIGKNKYGQAGERLNISHGPDPRSTGAPLLNEYGEVVGIVGGSLLPGATLLPHVRLGYGLALPGFQGFIRGGLAIPIELVSLSGARPSSLPEMMTNGQFTPPLSGSRNVLSGHLGRSTDKKRGLLSVIESREEFSARDGQFQVVITWDPKEKRKGLSRLRVYDLNNRMLVESKPAKLDLKTGELLSVGWSLPTTVAPGIYRIDVYLDNEAVWRTFFRIKD